MNALQILVDAHDRFARNRANWIQGRLSADRASAEGGQCNCAIGGILRSGGGYPVQEDGKPATEALPFSLGSKAKKYLTLNPKEDNEWLIASSIFSGAPLSTLFIPTILDDTAHVIKVMEKEGFAARSAIVALRYLAAACWNLFGERTGIISVNDGDGCAFYSYDKVLKMYKLAIKNCKRRHVNGGRLAVKAA